MRKKHKKTPFGFLMAHGNFKKIPKRAQMEMAGLVIIVILITLGMLFMARFALTDKGVKKKIFVREGLAFSTMNALMKTGALCEHHNEYGEIETKTLAIETTLIEDCANYQNEYPYRSHFRCQNQHTCDFLNDTIRNLLNQTLGKWHKHYQFSSSLVYETEEIPLLQITDQAGKGCPGERDTSGLFPIYTSPGLVENILYLCD